MVSNVPPNIILVTRSLKNIAESDFGRRVRYTGPASAMFVDDETETNTAQGALEVLFENELSDEEQKAVTDLIVAPECADWRDEQCLWIWPTEERLNEWLNTIMPLEG